MDMFDVIMFVFCFVDLVDSVDDYVLVCVVVVGDMGVYECIY